MASLVLTDNSQLTSDSFKKLPDQIMSFRLTAAVQLKAREGLRIQFDDSLTSTFEYPSEASLLEDSAPTAAPLGGGSLSSYTPSKVHLGTENFQLGITRATPPPPVPSPPPARDADDLDEYLKPALDEDIVPWSVETAADLLF
uniref:Uncharacterized protein n=1 Tax=Timema monikensis TaxID=170555 RepID=A0A7R9HTD4_9NEOP|nr:unnamed protein product [Timema monikensis]